jgi:hypothetical protein
MTRLIRNHRIMPRHLRQTLRYMAQPARRPGEEHD